MIRWRRPSGSALSAMFLGAVGLVFAARSLVLGVTLSSPVPTFDSWAFVDDLALLRAGHYGLADLFSQHNEHRIVTARLHFLLDYALFDLGNLSVVLANYLLLAILSVVLAAAATRGRPLHVKAATAALALAAIWSAAGWINLVWAFQIQWAYVHLMPVLCIVAFVAAARGDGVRRWSLLAAACLFDALGVFSMSSGLVTVVPVVAVALWIRASPRLIGAVLLVHAAVTLLFLSGYDAPSQQLVTSPAAIVRYLAPYLGTAIPASKAVSIVIGSVGLALAIVGIAGATWIATVRRTAIDGALAALLGTVVFVLAEGLVTAIGRAGMPNPTLLALRYATPSELFWTALALGAWRWLGTTDRRRASRVLAAVALCGVVASNTLGGTSAAWRLWSVQADNEGFNLINGVKTDERGQGLDPLPEQDRIDIDLMRSLQLGPFAESARRFRAPLNSLAGARPASLPACAGAVDQVTVRDGRLFHLQGWAVSPGIPVSSAWALAFGPDGQVLGYARTWQQREDRRRISGRAVVLGYDFWFRRPSGEAGERIDLVAVFPGQTAPPCRVPTPYRPTEVASPSGPS